MEKRDLPLEAAELDLEERDGGIAQIRGYAAVFYDGSARTEFRMGKIRERIMPGAFRRVIDKGDDVRALFNHDPNYVLGRRSAKTLKLFEDSKGLRYIVDTPNTQAGRDVAELLRRGDVTGSSFGFKVDDEEFRQEGEDIIREIRSFARLSDVGPVTYPAYQGSEASLRSAEEAYKEWLQTQSRHDIALREKELDLEELSL